MTEPAPRPETHSDAQIQAIITELNTNVPNHRALQARSNQSGILIRRAVDAPELTYIRLAGKDEAGGPIVLMLLDGVSERAI